MKLHWLTGLALCLALPAQGQDLTPDEFEALTEGKVLESYFPDGRLLGHELYLQDRRVLWQPAEGPCKNGKWQLVGDYICYFYEVLDPGDCMIYSRKDDAIQGVSDVGGILMHRFVDASVMTCDGDMPMSSIAVDRNLTNAGYSR